MVVMIAYILKHYNVLSCRSCKLLVMVSMEFSFHFQSINIRLRSLWALLLIYTVQHFTFLINEGGHLLPWSDTLLSFVTFPMTLMHWNNSLAFSLCLIWGGYVHAMLHVLNSVPLPHALRISLHELPVTFQALLMVPPWFSNPFCEFGSSSGLVTGILAWQTVSYYVSSQEGLMGFIRACESHCTDASHTHTQSYIHTSPSFRNNFFLSLGLLWLET